MAPWWWWVRFARQRVALLVVSMGKAPRPAAQDRCACALSFPFSFRLKEDGGSSKKKKRMMTASLSNPGAAAAVDCAINARQSEQVLLCNCTLELLCRQALHPCMNFIFTFVFSFGFSFLSLSTTHFFFKEYAKR